LLTVQCADIIVGKRYHATNWEDFDLCEECWTNYEGSDVQFEDVKLGEMLPSCICIKHLT
jgi:hypothetical protein